MGRLREWWLDWIDRSGTEPSDGRIEDPISLVPRILAALGGLALIGSGEAVAALVPDLNPNAAMVLRGLVILVTLVAANHVVTAKDAAETVAGMRSRTVSTYRFSETERWIARGVVVLPFVLLGISLVPAPDGPRGCDLTAKVAWPAPGGTAKPLFLSLFAGGREDRYPVAAGQPIAMPVPAAHLQDYSVSLLWSDSSRSEFGQFSGCPEATSKGASDGRATIDLAGREDPAGG